MAPSNVARKRTWFLEPREVEQKDAKNLAYVLDKRLEFGDNGDIEVLREELLAESETSKDDEPKIEPELNEDGEVHDGLCLSYVI